jgi:copper chaperone
MNNMKNIQLSIPDMQSAHCQERVNTAAKNVQGAKIDRLVAGKLYASIESNEVEEELVKAVEKAGYHVDAVA